VSFSVFTCYLPRGPQWPSIYLTNDKRFANQTTITNRQFVCRSYFLLLFQLFSTNGPGGSLIFETSPEQKEGLWDRAHNQTAPVMHHRKCAIYIHIRVCIKYVCIMANNRFACRTHISQTRRSEVAFGQRHACLYRSLWAFVGAQCNI